MPVQSVGLDKDAIEELVRDLVGKHAVLPTNPAPVASNATVDQEIVQRITDLATQRHQSYLTKF